MAKARGTELPDVLRMMLTRAVQLRDFTIDLADHEESPKRREPVDPFEPRYGGPYKATIDAELALALLRRSLADASARQDEARQTDPQDQHKQEREQLSRERQEALRLLADHDVGHKRDRAHPGASLGHRSVRAHIARHDQFPDQGDEASQPGRARPLSGGVLPARRVRYRPL